MMHGQKTIKKIYTSVNAENQTRVVVKLVPANNAGSRSWWLKAVRRLSISGMAGSTPAEGMLLRLLCFL
jgi:hypothetical protein